MAKQNGPIVREETIGCLNFYKRGGRGFVRMKSSLTGERWHSDPAFAGSRKSAASMAQASVLASSYYKTIPKQQRRFSDYRCLVGVAWKALSSGHSEQDTREQLTQAVARICQSLAANEIDSP